MFIEVRSRCAFGCALCILEVSGVCFICAILFYFISVYGVLGCSSVLPVGLAGVRCPSARFVLGLNSLVFAFF